MDELAHLGERLRAYRLGRDLTLEQLAARTAVSISTLSRLESGKRQASLELLLPITRSLGIGLDDLIRPQAPDPRVTGTAVRRDGMLIARLSPEGSPVQTYKITYPPGRELPRLRVHDGYEWLYVLSGRLRLRLGERNLVLTHGEAAEFDTRIPHAMSADGRRPAQVISIFNDAGERMHTRLAQETTEDQTPEAQKNGTTPSE